MLRLSTISILKFSAFLLLLSMPHLFFAQGTIWKNVENEPNVAGKRYFIPSKYRVIQLDIEQLKPMALLPFSKSPKKMKKTLLIIYWTAETPICPSKQTRL